MTIQEINKTFGVIKPNQSFYYSKKKYKDYTRDMSSEERFEFGQSIVAEIKKLVEVVPPLRSYHKQFFVDMGFDRDGKGIEKTLYTVIHPGHVLIRDIQQEYIKQPIQFDLMHYLVTGEPLPPTVPKMELNDMEDNTIFIQDISEIFMNTFITIDQQPKPLFQDHSNKMRRHLAQRLFDYVELGFTVQSIYTKLSIT